MQFHIDQNCGRPCSTDPAQIRTETIVTDNPIMSRAAMLATIVTSIIGLLSPCLAVSDAKIGGL